MPASAPSPSRLRAHPTRLVGEAPGNLPGQVTNFARVADGRRATISLFEPVDGRPFLEPDVELIGWVGACQLENLLRDRGDKLWPHIERLARGDRRFRRALRSV